MADGQAPVAAPATSVWAQLSAPKAKSDKHGRCFHLRVETPVGLEWNTAAQTLLETTHTMGRLRGRFHDYRGTKLMPTYHPAYLLRSPEMKGKTWSDLKMVMAELGLSRPAR